MNINTNKLFFNKDSFYLNDDNIPSDQNKFHDGLTILANDALEALKQPDEVEWAFQQIEKLNTQKLSSNNTNTQIQTVFQKWIKIQIGDESRYISKEHLQKHCGKKFQGQFTTNMKDKNSKTLVLSAPEGVNISDIPAVVREGFLSYLQTGVVSDDAVEENVMSLMGLAYQHQVDSLVEHCSSLIQEILDDENLEIVLEFIKDRHLPYLRWACLEYMYAHPENIPEGLTKDDQEALNCLQEIKKLSLKCEMSTQGKLKVNITKRLKSSIIEYLEKINNKFPISTVHFLIEQKGCLPLINKMSQQIKNIEELIINDPSFSTEQYIKIQGQFPKLNSVGNDAPFLSSFDEVKVYLKHFSNPEDEEADLSLKKLTLRSLNLSKIHNLTDSQLEELTPHLQVIFHLSIKSDKITKLDAPKASRVCCDGCTSLKILEANQAKIVECRGCRNLEALEANQAELINCHDCTSLETFEANQANKVYCKGCTNLKTLQASKAVSIECESCTNLKTLEANQAELISCDDCTSLETLQANQAKKVVCWFCIKLESLQVDQAIIVDCRGCTSLKTLQVDQAKIVDCRGCTSLKTLQANQAKKVDCIGCTNLKTLLANQANKVYCKDCKSLDTLQVNKAKEVDCRGCTSLKTLQANQAEMFDCRGFTNLKALELNQAEEVYCSSFTNLETLKANQAKKVYCYGCTSLETLQANQADLVNCYGCTSLKTLEVYQAIMVCCDGCKRLKTIQANLATEINCRGCTSLKTLQANNAEKVDCEGCSSLKTLEVNQAKEVYCKGCISLKTLQANKAKTVDCDGCKSLENC